jgi:hypothetical protein
MPWGHVGPETSLLRKIDAQPGNKPEGQLFLPGTKVARPF